MGQSASAEASGKGKNPDENVVLELFTKNQICDLFHLRIMHLLSKSELALITEKLNVTVANDANAVVTYSDLAYLLQMQNDKNLDVASVNLEFAYAIKLLYGSFKVLGNLPFLQDSLNSDNDDQLTLKRLSTAAIVHMDRLRKIWPDYDYLKLVFLSIALSTQFDSLSEKPTGIDLEKIARKLLGDEPFVVELEKLPSGHHDDKRMDVTANRIHWSTFSPLTTYDELNPSNIEISAFDLVQIFTLLLMEYGIPQKSHQEMQKQLESSINKKWSEFEQIAVELVRYLNIEVTASNMKSKTISFQQFKSGVEVGLGDFLPQAFRKMFKHGFLSMVTTVPAEEDAQETPNEQAAQNDESQTKKKDKSIYKFEETRLINNASLAYISVFLKAVNASVSVSLANIVELYNGSHSGFSIRSLELKIFKWHAPTVFIVSGKRLRSKTITTNKRYQQFDSEYPRYFRSSEDPNKEWQSDLDSVRYLVYVSQPWKNSNKKNFGDEQTAIMCMLPRYDFFTSRPDPVLQGQLIYFNNLGMGVGFGNDQPVNKNKVRKYLPGSVSLTVEANLEFGVFRHVANAGANTPNYFRRSEQEVVGTQDYEDRFMITDLEVWGIGSNKELDEQRKQWEWEEKQARARQSVNMRSLGEDRAFLEMAGLIGPHGGGSV